MPKAGSGSHAGGHRFEPGQSHFPSPRNRRVLPALRPAYVQKIGDDLPLADQVGHGGVELRLSEWNLWQHYPIREVIRNVASDPEVSAGSYYAEPEP